MRCPKCNAVYFGNDCPDCPTVRRIVCRSCGWTFYNVKEE